MRIIVVIGNKMADFNIDENIILASAFLFEKLNGKSLSSYEEEIIKTELFIPVSKKDLIDQICDFIENSLTSNEVRSSAYWSLGKAFDSKLLSFFQEKLAFEIRNECYNCIYQILIALDNLGENIFREETSLSIDKEEENLMYAKSYLET
jgi:hypothetical protein